MPLPALLREQMPEYKFNSMNYLSGGVVTVGPVKKKTYFVDGSDAYANNRKLFISFHHVPTGKDVFFKAFITAFNETYNSDWSSESVYGRADPIYLFKLLYNFYIQTIQMSLTQQPFLNLH